MKRSKNGIDGRPAVANLPEEIIFYNILTRVPDKSLNQFRCVCKQWSNLPDDPLFKSSMRSHHRRDNHKTDDSNVRGFICCKEDYLVGGDANKLTSYIFSFLDADNKECKQIPFQLPSDTNGDRIRNRGAYVNIVDSMNGVLLLRFSEQYTYNDQLYVYNPGCGCGLRIRPIDYINLDYYSLAYDPIISRYKVVTHEEKYFHIRTVPDGKYSWRRFLKPRHYTWLLHKPVYVDYALHWICGNENYIEYDNILRLDACDEEVSIIKLPVKSSSRARRLLKMGGLLWFIHSVHGHNHRLKLWYLKKKNHNNGHMDREWVAKCSINLATGISSQQLKRYSWSREPVILVTNPKCRIIFTFVDRKKNNNRCIYSYDMEIKHWDLIHAGPVCFDDNKSDKRELCYWYDNKNALCLNNAEETEDMQCLLYNGDCKLRLEGIIRSFSKYYEELKQ